MNKKDKTHKDRIIIIIEVILIIILFCVLMDSNQNLKTQVYIITSGLWRWCADERTVGYFLAILGIFLTIYFNIRSKKTNKQKPISKKYLPQSIFKINSVNDLDKVIINPPFVENKEIDIIPGKNRAWKDLKNEIVFTGFEPLDLSDDFKLYFITGTFGVGKSTFMLTQINNCLANKKSTIKKIVFLNPFSSERWFESLTNFEPQKTLLVLDGLLRGQYEKGEFAKTCKSLISLADGVTSEDNTSSVGPFKILITVRTDEFDQLMSEELVCMQNLYKKYEIKEHAHESLKQIIENYLRTYKVRSKVKGEKKDSVLNQLISKSEGLPFYFRHFFITLKKNNEHLTEDKVNDCPTGVVNLIWQTIKNRYYQPFDKVIPLLLLLFAKNNHFFSSYLINFINDKLAERHKKTTEKKLNGLKFYFQNIGKSVDSGRKPYIYYNLNSNWKTSILSVFEPGQKPPPELQNVHDAYIQINDCEYENLIEDIAKQLKYHLSGGLKNIADSFLIVDLAKLSENNLVGATELYTEFQESSKLDPEYIEFIKEELYQLWISYAWTYRSRHKICQANTCYENAFDKLGVRSNKKDISSYAYFLKKYILPDLEYGSEEYKACVQKTEKTYKEAIDLDRKDKISWQTFGIFYQDLGEYQKADECFEEALKIEPNHIPSIQAFARFLKRRGKVEWVKNQEKALEYYNKAEAQFLHAKKLLEDGFKDLRPNETEEFEKRLLNAYAIFLIDKTEWFREFEERIRINNEVDAILDNLLKKYPKHGQSITVYTRFLFGYARILPQYKNGKNLIKAEELLNNFINGIEEEKKQKDLSYFISLHILANYLYKIKPSYYRQPIQFDEVEKLLEKSSKSFNSKHNSIALNELGKLYVCWANTSERNSIEYKNKMAQAKNAYISAMDLVPENNETALHLSKVYFNYAFLSQYLNENPENYIDKALEIAQKFAYVPFAHYYNLTCIGDEILKYGDIEQAEKVFHTASELGKNFEIKPSYPLFKLAHISEQKKDFEKALDLYHQSAIFQNTSAGYTAKRYSIKQMMFGNAFTNDLNNKCLEKCKELSQKAYNLSPDVWKKSLDYGEDLFKNGQFKLAIDILTKGVPLIKNSNKFDGGEHLGMFYFYIGSCYKSMENSSAAENYFNKIESTQSSAFGYINIFRHFIQMNEPNKAAKYFNEFLKAYPKASDDQKEKVYRSISKDFQKYAECMEQLNNINESAIIWMNYADLYYYSNSPNGAKTYGMIGNKLLKNEMFDYARDYFIKSLKLDQQNETKGQNFSQLGSIYERFQMWNEAYICYANAVELRPDNHRDKTRLEYCTVRRLNLNMGNEIEDIDSMINKAVVFELRNDLNSAMGKYEEALSLLLENGNLDCGNALSKLRFIADAFFVSGRRDDAIELYNNQILESVAGIEKIVIESVIWFISNDEDENFE